MGGLLSKEDDDSDVSDWTWDVFDSIDEVHVMNSQKGGSSGNHESRTQIIMLIILIPRASRMSMRSGPPRD
jgi:hypothetical protein